MVEEKKDDFLEQVSGKVEDNKEQIARAETDVRLHEEAVEMMIREFELNTLLNDVIKKSHKLLEPTYEFHKEEEFWLIQEELRAIDVRRKQVDAEMKIERSKEIVETKRAELARLKGE